MGAASGGYTRLEFSIPARGLIGYRGEFMTDTKGNGIINTIFDELRPVQGRHPVPQAGFPHRLSRAARRLPTACSAAQERGTLFIGPGEKVYAGMVIGQNGRSDDIEVQRLQDANS